MTDIKALTALNHRVWYVEGGVHPTRPPELLALGKFSTDPTKAIGEDSRITAPDPNNFSRDIQIGTVKATEERATLSIAIRNTTQESILMRWKNKGCAVDIYALSGKCGNPQDFTDGGEKMVFFEDTRIGSHGFENFGAFGRDEDNATNESVDMTSNDYWEFLKLGQEQIGGAVTTREIFTIDVYIGNDCENCPEPCDRVLATMAGSDATPGTQPVLLFSGNGGETFSQDTISTMFSNEAVTGSAIIGGDLVLITNQGNELHYTDIELVYDLTNVWQQVDDGFVGNGVNDGPNAISSADARNTWIVADNGYIYFVKNHKVGVTVQDAGVLTTEDLQDVHAHDAENVLVVGDNNTVIYTKNGGETWKSITGPSVGVNLGACWEWDSETWFIGEGVGGTGKLWLTVNSGQSWSEVDMPASYNRIYKIEFISQAEGYISAQSGGQSFVLRTLTAGNEWVVLPEGKQGVSVDNTFLPDLAVCNKFGNTVFAAGIADNGTAGIILKMTA